MFERQVTCLVPGRSMETYHGQVRTPADAIILFEACRVGLLPRVQRRLSEKERASIGSGSVFVWDEREAGMRRWTDGKSWSASRVSGSFLTYREMEGKRGGPSHSTAASTSASGGKKQNSTEADESPDSYRYKADGLMKQSFSISTSTGQHLHLISYYSRAPHLAHGLPIPTQDPRLRHIRPEKGMYPESNMPDQQSPHSLIAGPGSGRAPHGSPSYAAVHGPQPPTNSQPPFRHTQYDFPPYRSAPGGSQTGWVPPSPIHTPGQSPYLAHANHSHAPPGNVPPQSSLQQMHYPPPTSVQHIPGQLTAFDRPPAPLSNKNVPPIPAPATSASSPYYTASSNHQQSYPPPPSAMDRLTPPDSRRLPSLEASASENRPDSVLAGLGRLEPSPPNKSRGSPAPTRTIPSISALISGVLATDPTKSEERPAPPRALQNQPSAQIGLFNPDTRALRDLDKLTFRA